MEQVVIRWRSTFEFLAQHRRNQNLCTCMAFLIVIMALIVFAETASAKPPSIERLFPPGGQRGTSVDAKFTGAPGDGTLQVWSQQQQLQFEVSDKQDTAKVTIPQDAAPGVHWLRFHNKEGATDFRPFIVGLIPELNESEPNNQPVEAQAVEQPTATVNGVLEKSADVDIFAINLQPGQTLVAQIEANRILGSPMDSVLQLLDSQGTVIAQNDDDHGFDPQIIYPVTVAGTYYLRLFAFPETPNSTIKLSASATYVYRLTFTSGPFAEFTLPAVVNLGTDATVGLHGWNLSDSGKITVSKLDDQRMFVEKNSALPVFLSTVPHASVVETPGEDQMIPIPSSLTGIISTAEETDRYTFAAKAKQKLTVTVDARSLGSQLDPVVTVRAADGKVLKEADDRQRADLDAEAAFTVPSDGNCIIEVTDRYRAGGSRFFYVLTCQPTVPSFEATVKSSTFALPADKPLEIPVALSRKNGFAEKIEIQLSGLPDGLECKPQISENKGDTQKSVTLSLSQQDGSQAWSGVVHVVCTGQDTKVPQPATVAIGKSTHKTSEFWLTVAGETKSEKPAK